MTGFLLGALLFSGSSVESVGGGTFIEAFEDSSCKHSRFISVNTITELRGYRDVTIVYRGSLGPMYICTPYQTILQNAKSSQNKK